MCEEKQQSLWEKTADPRLECDTQTSSMGASHWLRKMGCQIRAHKRQWFHWNIKKKNLTLHPVKYQVRNKACNLQTTTDVAKHCLFRATAGHEAQWDGNKEGKTRETRMKTCYSATASTRNLTHGHAGLNHRLCIEQPTSNFDSYGTA
jgi:hypothetical protein